MSKTAKLSELHKDKFGWWFSSKANNSRTLRPLHNSQLFLWCETMTAKWCVSLLLLRTLRDFITYELSIRLLALIPERQLLFYNIKYVLDHDNRRNRYSKKKPLRSSARGASFHAKHASNTNVVRVVLLDANSYLAPWNLRFTLFARNLINFYNFFVVLLT
jgi:hypothetical protein